MTSGTDLNIDHGTTFQVTPMIVIFLEHTINQCTQKPIYTANPAVSKEVVSFQAANETLKKKITNWATFKQTLFEILDDRLFWAPEISGAVNTSYLGLDEHLLIFML